MDTVAKSIFDVPVSIWVECALCLVHIKENSATRKKLADHAKNVRGNAKHAQVSTEEGAVGLWEAISHARTCHHSPSSIHLQWICNLRWAMQMKGQELKQRRCGDRCYSRRRPSVGKWLISWAPVVSKIFDNWVLVTRKTHPRMVVETTLIWLQAVDIPWRLLVQYWWREVGGVFNSKSESGLGLRW